MKLIQTLPTVIKVRLLLGISRTLSSDPLPECGHTIPHSHPVHPSKPGMREPWDVGLGLTPPLAPQGCPGAPGAVTQCLSPGDLSRAWGPGERAVPLRLDRDSGPGLGPESPFVGRLRNLEELVRGRLQGLKPLPRPPPLPRSTV